MKLARYQTTNDGPRAGVQGRPLADVTLGPWIVTTDELAPHFRAGVLDLHCTVSVNSVIWADSNSMPVPLPAEASARRPDNGYAGKEGAAWTSR